VTEEKEKEKRSGAESKINGKEKERKEGRRREKGQMAGEMEKIDGELRNIKKKGEKGNKERRKEVVV
jgi:hypothetical protein